MTKERSDFTKIRPLMAFPVAAQDGESICLRDPEGYSDKTLFINHATYLMITLMDGTRNTKEIQSDFMGQTGAQIPSGQIEELIERLREVYFLDDPVFHNHARTINETFLNSPVRAAVHRGTAYPENPDELSSFLHGFYDSVKEKPVGNGDPKGIIVPHIDIRHAGTCYAAAYSRLRECRATTLIILGTAHSNIGNFRYAICPKDFETPFGLLPCDREGIRILCESSGIDWTLGQIGHRTEHSIEFQTVFLRHLFPNREIRIIPVLCNTLADLMESPDEPMQDSSIRDFTEAVGNLMRQRPGDIVLIAGADLSHVGPKFGHPEPLKESELTALGEHDQSLMNYAGKGDPEGFFRQIQREKDDHNVCGVPNIYTLLKILEGEKGELLEYGQFFEAPTASAVSYASLVF
jgi:AmmeMemoRadiSam system protein B